MSEPSKPSEMPELPELHESVLDEATVDQLFTDIKELTQIVEVIPKTVSKGNVQEGSISLDEGRRMLRDGSCRALQIRYVHDGAQWWDTLMTQPDGTRVVRIRHDPNGPT